MATLIDFSDTLPAAPAGHVNGKWQAVYVGTDPATGYAIRSLSLYVPAAGGGPVPAGATHDEPLTDGNANFIFAATLAAGGDIIVVLGVPN